MINKIEYQEIILVDPQGEMGSGENIAQLSTGSPLAGHRPAPAVYQIGTFGASDAGISFSGAPTVVTDAMTESALTDILEPPPPIPSIDAYTIPEAGIFGDALRGLGAGARGTINGLAQAGYGGITFGFGETNGPFTLDSWDLAMGAGTSQAIANASGNIVIGAGTGYAGCVGGRIGGVAKMYDLASNVVEFGRGAAEGNASQMIGAGLGLGTNFLSKCFTAGTQIVVGLGYDESGNILYDTKNIEEIQVGDWVYSYDTATGEYGYREVTNTFVRKSDHVNYLTIVDEQGREQTLETTDGHPFWVVTDEPDLSRAARSVVDENGTWLYHDNLDTGLNGYWVEAKDLRVGDVFLGADGKLSSLTNAVRLEVAGGISVFNFEVEGNHNYFVLAKEYGVGQTCVLVHNASRYNNPLINSQKQDGHVLGTPQYNNRINQGKPTSAFPDRATAESAVTDAKSLGGSLPNRPEVIEYDTGRIIGTDLSGNATSVVRVHVDLSGFYHGYPH